MRTVYQATRCHIYEEYIFINITLQIFHNYEVAQLIASTEGVSGGAHAVAQLVDAPQYKSEGLGFDSRWCHWNCSLT